jgi:hypothetical protein
MVPVWASTPRTVSCLFPAHSRPACLLGKRLAAPKALIIQIHYGGIKTSVLHIQPKSFALPTQHQAQPLFFLRLSFSTALSERLSCSLNLIEPHLGPDLRSTLSVDLGGVPELILERSVYDPRNPNECPILRFGHQPEPTLLLCKLIGYVNQPEYTRRDFNP